MENKEVIINPKTLGGFVRTLSGFFITKDNPNGLTNSELKMLSKIIVTLEEQKKTTIDKEVKIKLAELNNTKLQVSMNYINKLKSKGVITEDEKVHPIFYKRKITIVPAWKEQYVTR